MGNNYQHYFIRQFKYCDILSQWKIIKQVYPNAQIKKNGLSVEIYLELRPTEDSRIYKVKLVTQPLKTKVRIFVVDPNIKKMNFEQRIPHRFLDGSLCLFYPKYREWSIFDSWAETLIPWTSLWLYFFEIWVMTGEWQGGGVHPKVKEKKV